MLQIQIISLFVHEKIFSKIKDVADGASHKFEQ